MNLCISNAQIKQLGKTPQSRITTHTYAQIQSCAKNYRIKFTYKICMLIMAHGFFVCWIFVLLGCVFLFFILR